jgi:hypothetical protein
MIQLSGWIVEEVGKPGKGVKFVMTLPKLNEEGKNNYIITREKES